MAKDPIKKADNGTYYFRANFRLQSHYRKTDTEIPKWIQNEKRSKGRIFKTGVSFYRRIDNKKRWRFFSAIYRRNLPAMV